MKKILFVCNTYFQLITAINIGFSILKDEYKDILITDTSNSLLSLKEKIQKSNLFSNVFTFERKKVIQRNNKLESVLLFAAGKYTFQTPIPSAEYTDLMFYNFDLLVCSIIEMHNKKKKGININRFEEGYISYFYGNIDSRVVKIGNKLRKFSGRSLDFLSSINDYYFYEPDFVQFSGPYKLKKIPKFVKGQTEIKNILNYIFDIDNVSLDIQEKYVFFEEPFSLNKKNNINDLELVDELARIVGRENLIVKLHPRTEKNRFEDLNIKTYNNPLPWELIQLNGDFEKKIFLTISSGSVLQSKILFEENIKTILLFNCISHKPKLVNKKYYKHIENITNKYSGEFIIPDTLNYLKV